MDTFARVNQNSALGCHVRRCHGALAFGQLKFAPIVNGSNVAFKKIDLGLRIIDPHKELGALDHAIDKRGDDFEAAGPAAEKVGGPLEKFENKGPLRFNFGKHQGCILIQPYYGIIAEYDTGSAVGTDADLIPGKQGVVQTDRPPVGLT